MKLQTEQLILLSEIAIKAGREAAKLISEYAQGDIKVEKKAFGESLASQVVTEADRLSQEIIIKELQPCMQPYDLGLLAEESDDDKSRLIKDYFWCIDPIDGTLSFTRKQPGYSVSIGLISKDGVPLIGVIVDPMNDTIYHAVKGVGAYKNTQKLELSELMSSKNSVTLVCDEGFMRSSGFEPFMNTFRNKLSQLGYESVEVKQGGGAVMNAMYVLENKPSCYFKFPKQSSGGGSFWDFAASCCIYNEIGALATDFRKAALNLNNPESIYMNKHGVIYSTEEVLRDVVTDMYDGFML